MLLHIRMEMISGRPKDREVVREPIRNQLFAHRLDITFLMG